MTPAENAVNRIITDLIDRTGGALRGQFDDQREIRLAWVQIVDAEIQAEVKATLLRLAETAVQNPAAKPEPKPETLNASLERLADATEKIANQLEGDPDHYSLREHLSRIGDILAES